MVSRPSGRCRHPQLLPSGGDSPRGAACLPTRKPLLEEYTSRTINPTWEGPGRRDEWNCIGSSLDTRVKSTSSEFGRLPRWRTDEPLAHEGLRLVVGSPGEGQGPLVEPLSPFLDPREPLVDRLQSDGRRLPREDLRLLHRGHNVLLVEARLLRDLRELLRRRDAHLVRDRPGSYVAGSQEDD